MTSLIAIVLLSACAASVETNSSSCTRSDGRALLQVGIAREAMRDLAVEHEPDFKVLVVGAPRTGTQSMLQALTRLGFNPLHSAHQLQSRAPWCRHLSGKTSFQQALLTMKGYDSAMDEPFHLIYEEVLQQFPNCKFILTESDPEKWYTSCQQFWQSHQLVPVEIKECQHFQYFECDFMAPPTPELKQRCLAGYKAHAERVKRLVPAEKLLVFNLSDGYRPLAEFLGKPVPDEPFPYVDIFNLQRMQTNDDGSGSYGQAGVGGDGQQPVGDGDGQPGVGGNGQQPVGDGDGQPGIGGYGQQAVQQLGGQPFNSVGGDRQRVGDYGQA